MTEDASLTMSHSQERAISNLCMLFVAWIGSRPTYTPDQSIQICDGRGYPVMTWMVWNSVTFHAYCHKHVHLAWRNSTTLPWLKLLRPFGYRNVRLFALKRGLARPRENETFIFGTIATTNVSSIVVELLRAYCMLSLYHIHRAIHLSFRSSFLWKYWVWFKSRSFGLWRRVVLQ
jgi:hypothetical protein